MSGLPSIVYPPPTGAPGQQEFYWNHQTVHQGIITNVKRIKGVTLTDFRLYPVDSQNLDEWARQHQQSHTEISQVLGTLSDDFSAMSFKSKQEMDSWFWRHYMAHLAIDTAIGSSNG